MEDNNGGTKWSPETDAKARFLMNKLTCLFFGGIAITTTTLGAFVFAHTQPGMQELSRADWLFLVPACCGAFMTIGALRFDARVRKGK